MISPASTAMAISELGDYVFRTVPSTFETAMAMGRHIDQRLQPQRMAVFFNSDSPYSVSLKDSIEFHFNHHSSEQIEMSIVDVDQQDFNPEAALENIVTGKTADLIILVTDQSSHRETATRIIRANNRQLPIIAGDDIYSQRTLEDGAEHSLGIVIAVPWHALTNPSALFPVDSRALWGKDVNWLSATAYDATQAFMKALRDTPSYDRNSIQQVLANPEFVAPGAASDIQFQETGDRQFALTMVEVVTDDTSEIGYRFVPINISPEVDLSEPVNAELPTE